MASTEGRKTSDQPTKLSPDDEKILLEAFQKIGAKPKITNAQVLKKWMLNYLGESVKIERENPTSDKGQGQDSRDRNQDAPSNVPSQYSSSRPSNQANYLYSKDFQLLWRRR